MNITKLAILALLLMLLAPAGCGKNDVFDIRGTWSFRSGTEEVYAITFWGTAESGALVEARNNAATGTYTVSGKEVVFELLPTLDHVGAGGCRFHGSFTGGEEISGTMELFWPYPPFGETKEVVGKKYLGI
jgi:hypothetical protein